MTPSGPRAPGERGVRLLLRLAPRRFRSRHEDDLVDCHRDAWADTGDGRVVTALRFGLRSLASTVVVVVKQRFASGQREVAMGGGSWWQEARHATRRLARRPGFSAAVVLTLGLGLGANTAVFTVLQSVLLAPLPYEASERLVRIYQARLDRPEMDRLHLPTPSVSELRDEVPALADVAVLYNASSQSVDITDGDRPERLRQLAVNAGYFRTLGVSPVAGRFFERTEETPDARVAVVTSRVWEQYMGGRPEALGGSLTLDGEAIRIVGVVDDGFRDPLEGRVDVFTPLDLQTEAGYWDNNWLTAYGLVERDADPGLLRSQLDVLEARHAAMDGVAAERGYATVPLMSDIVGESSTLLLAVMGAVLFLLLLTAVNVASLLASRAATREREMAIRTSLGSPRGSLIRDFMVETLLLSLAGGVAGWVIGRWALDLIVAIAPDGLPRLESIHPGSSSILFASFGALVLGVGLGLVIAAPFSRPSLQAVTAGTRSEGSAQGGRRVRRALVRVEVALAVVLLTGAGTLVRTVDALTSRDLGPEADGVLVFEVGLPGGRYADDPAIHAFNRRFHEVALGVPGVRFAASTSRLPVTGSFNTWGTRRAYGPDAPMDVENTSVNQRWISGDYFETVGLGMVAGRSFDPSDEAGGTYATVVNETFVRTLFGDEDPVGQWIRMGGRYARIVGVVEDAWLTARTPPAPTAYHHIRQWISGSRILTQAVRVGGDPMAVVPALREALREVDPDLVLFEPTRMADVIGRGIESERFAATLLGTFAALAVLVAGLGLYGLLSQDVGRQQHEIGVRMALGADRRGVVVMVVRRGLWLATTGLVVGLVLAVALAGVLDSLVYGVSTRDPLVLGMAPVVLLVVALLSSSLPAARATRVDPAQAFRAD